MKLWIARNEDLRLLIFPCKPNVNINKITDLHYWTCYNAMEISPDRFPEVTFENSPQEVELKLMENEQK